MYTLSIWSTQQFITEWFTIGQRIMTCLEITLTTSSQDFAPSSEKERFYMLKWQHGTVW